MLSACDGLVLGRETPPLSHSSFAIDVTYICYVIYYRVDKRFVVVVVDGGDCLVQVVAVAVVASFAAAGFINRIHQQTSTSWKV